MYKTSFTNEKKKKMKQTTKKERNGPAVFISIHHNSHKYTYI